MIYLMINCNGYYAGLNEKEVFNKHWDLFTRSPLPVYKCASVKEAQNLIEEYLSENSRTLFPDVPSKLVVGKAVMFKAIQKLILFDFQKNRKIVFVNDNTASVFFGDGTTGTYTNVLEASLNETSMRLIEEDGYIPIYSFDKETYYRRYSNGETTYSYDGKRYTKLSEKNESGKTLYKK